MMKKSSSVNGVMTGRPTHVRVEGATRGLYLYGGVGVGKTMLMDMFVATKPAQVKARTPCHIQPLEISACAAEKNTLSRFHA